MANKITTSHNPIDILQQGKDSGHFQMTFLGRNDGHFIDSNQNTSQPTYDPRQQLWYSQAMAQNKLIVTKPYDSQAFHGTVMTIAKPVNNGVVAANLPISTLIDGVNNLTLPTDGFAILMQKDGTVIGYKDKSKIMGSIRDIDNNLADQVLEDTQKNKLLSIHFNSENKDKLVWKQNIPDSNWILLFILDKNEAEAPLKHMLTTQLISSGVVLFISILAIYLIINQMLEPLVQVSKALYAIADGCGDLTQRLKAKTRDEVGELVRSFNRFMESQQQLVSHIRTLSSELGEDAEKTLDRSHELAEDIQRQQQEVNMVATAVT